VIDDWALSPPVVVLLASAALLVGITIGWFACMADRDWERTLDANERHWERINWSQQLDRRRALKRRFITDKGKAQWR
jgi:hypothetical protein